RARADDGAVLVECDGGQLLRRLVLLREAAAGLPGGRTADRLDRLTDADEGAAPDRRPVPDRLDGIVGVGLRPGTRLSRWRQQQLAGARQLILPADPAV